MKPVLVVVGAVLILGGLFLLWASTLGVEWNSTHNRALQKVPRVGRRQETFNRVAGLVAGPVCVVLGVVTIFMGVS